MNRAKDWFDQAKNDLKHAKKSSMEVKVFKINREKILLRLKKWAQSIGKEMGSCRGSNEKWYLFV